MRKVIISLVISAIVFAGVIALTNKALSAESGANDAEILKKLDDISNSQKTILQGIESLKQELYIIKIRITQQQ